MITRRDLAVAAISVLTTAAIAAVAQSAVKPVMHSRVFRWNDLKVQHTKTGEARGVFNAPTARLANFECHITTLNPGESPHPAHKHPDEELMIIREGTLEAVLNGVTNRVEAGGMIFCASDEMHGLRNVCTNPATYYVLRWTPHELAK
jgi:XRE family transcriptional regulator, regulator of sulfur utilization